MVMFMMLLLLLLDIFCVDNVVYVVDNENIDSVLAVVDVVGDDVVVRQYMLFLLMSVFMLLLLMILLLMMMLMFMTMLMFLKIFCLCC